MYAETLTSRLLWQLGHKIRIIHYNPDAFTLDGVTQRESKASRIARLLEAIAEEPVFLERIFMCYDVTSDSHLPQVAVNWQEAGRGCARVV